MKTIIKLSLIALIVSFSSFSTHADTVLPRDLETVGVSENLSHIIQSDLVLTTSTSENVTLSSYFNQGKPVIINPVYFTCPMLCHLIFDGLLESLKNSNLKPGKDFTILTISIDPEDTPSSARKFKQKAIDAIGKERVNEGWKFLVTKDEAQLKTLMKEIGFHYYYNTKTEEYAHAASIIFVAPNKSITRYLYGIEFDPFEIKLGLSEARENKSRSTVERVLLFCYNYDPQARAFVLQAVKIMRIGGIITVLFIGLMLYYYRRQEKKKNHE